ncbi:uncharacterized protein BT62DRAFT_999865 [Guyanagaster necrorhizus]|uniref:25S rRNA (uridine-N(3))-methyltransferase BMT5-like domain-containing protein n=1 Tax=Guyanagaster necrorhizus TaxID=856835 RepID=A0A9P8AXZ9_9AGAR|nr:uncharacterized protein BT62DRAFT_999865 [Guyanagaster necrorhizus MCA 3950]KAG7452103.1 hypothetical protein BT62DRAFT_999865 [Guyanagaster necrorhizus MCA 3950]
MGKAGKSLKSALQSQQSRQKHKEQINKAARILEQKAKSTRQPRQRTALVPSTSRPTIPFSATDTILLIGEGNFSFARALIQDAPLPLTHIPPSNITATAYDSEEECYSKYSDARAIVALLRECGVEVHFGVDASRLDKIPLLRGRRWNRICWNFPHAGKSITDQDRNILSNQVLIINFLRAAASLLKTGPILSVTGSKKRKRANDEKEEEAEETDEEKSAKTGARGTILITLRNVPPYTLWDIPRLAKHPPPPTSGSTQPNPAYIVQRSFVFHRNVWKGYEHRMTKGERAYGTGKTGEGGEDRTWEFCLRD